jgi:hypothetical protein
MAERPSNGSVLPLNRAKFLLYRKQRYSGATSLRIARRIRICPRQLAYRRRVYLALSADGRSPTRWVRWN